LNLPASSDGEFTRLMEAVENAQALIKEGHPINEAAVLFAKIQNKKDTTWLNLVNLQKTALTKLVKKIEAEEKAAAKAAEQTKTKAPIEFDDFSKLDLRVGTIETAEKVPKKDRLLQFTVNLGFETRTIISGIAEHYAPEDLLNKQVIVVANLKPKKLAGVESHGMILTAETPEGKLQVIQPAGPVPNGSMVK